MTRREFLGVAGTAGALSSCLSVPLPTPPGPPNIILIMADDLGWGDVGFNGNTTVRTPHLDRLSMEGIRFDRFYASSPVCSPTRGSCLTGRHPFRYGIRFAMDGHMPQEELTLAEMLRQQGYRTGHFGKWHLGTLDLSGKETGRWGGWAGEQAAENFSPPWENGFDVCFSTESKVPTWDPMVTPEREHGGVSQALTPGEAYGTFYWTGPGEVATDNLDGDDSRVIVDRAIPFIEQAVEQQRPFFAVIWFHTPHLPIVAGEKYAAMYKKLPGLGPHYFGSITAMDEQIGRLYAGLRAFGVERKTMLWFASDNGPEGDEQTDERNGSAGPFRGRKRSLYEGGVRVPAFLVWPEKVPLPVATNIPATTLDYVPTVAEALGVPLAGEIDGVSLMPIINGGRMDGRRKPIGFETPGQIALSDDRWKIYSKIDEDGKPLGFELYDLLADPGETTDLAEQEPSVVESMAARLQQWRASCTGDANRPLDPGLLGRAAAAQAESVRPRR